MAVPTILQKIADERRGDVEAARAERPIEQLIADATRIPATDMSLAEFLARPGISVIAEVKRASPSRGRIADIPEPVPLAELYVDGGAQGISVLTEPRHFLGSADDLRAVAAAVSIPVLRKDFLIDPYQVWEARLWGASACLLIVALLDTVETLGSMLATVREAGLEALVEIHDETELNVALEAGAKIVGVNHRNLHTFEVDLSLFERLRPRIPAGVVTVAESGIHGRETVERMANAGADAILVGEHVASSADPAAAVRALRGIA